MGNFSVRLPPGCSHHGISVHCMCVQISNLYTMKWPVLPSCMQLTLVSWYVASMLCCHCWMFSLSDSLLMQSYPSVGYGSFVRPCRSLCSITYLFSRAYTVSWLVQIKVMLYLQQPLTRDSSSMLPTCFPYSPLCSPTYIYVIYIYIDISSAHGCVCVYIYICIYIYTHPCADEISPVHTFCVFGLFILYNELLINSNNTDDSLWYYHNISSYAIANAWCYIVYIIVSQTLWVVESQFGLTVRR